MFYHLLLEQILLILEIKMLFEGYAKRFISEYDYIFYIPMEGVELEDNGVRCVDRRL